MKQILLSTLTVACLGTQVCAEAPFPPARADQVEPEDMKRLPTGHPRLFLTDFKLLLDNYRNTSQGRKLGDRIIYNAEQLLNVAPAKRHKTGRRLLTVSRNVIYRVANLAAAARLTGDRRFVDRARQELLAVCAFKDWNPDHFLDVAEMTLAVAIGYDWLYEFLTPEERETIAGAIVNLGLKPSLKGKNWWVNGTNNWCQVCHAGITAGALAVWERDPELARKIFNRALENLPNVMNISYSGNGAYPEGCGYWSYGTNFNVVLIAMLEAAFGTAFGLGDYQGLPASGDFIQACCTPSRHAYSYADNSRAEPGFTFATLWIISRYNKPQLFSRNLAASFNKYVTDRPRQVRHTQRLLPLALIYIDGLPETAATDGPTLYSSGANAKVPLVTMRSNWSRNSSWLGMKGGIAGASHGHMDSGSFTAEINGVPVAIDLGAENYNKIEQLGMSLWNLKPGSDRWKIFRIGAESHNIARFDRAVPDVTGRGELAGISENADGSRSVCFDLAAPYKGQVTSFIRTGTLHKDGSVAIADRISGAHPGALYSWQLCTPLEVETIQDNIITLKGPSDRRFMLTGVPKTGRWRAVPATELMQPYDAPNRGVSMLYFEFKVPASGEVDAQVELREVPASDR